MYYPNELYHHGILGMKWGIRRFQNPDGTLTAEGKIRYASRKDKKLAKIGRYVNLDGSLTSAGYKRYSNPKNLQKDLNMLDKEKTHYEWDYVSATKNRMKQINELYRNDYFNKELRNNPRLHEKNRKNIMNRIDKTYASNEEAYKNVKKTEQTIESLLNVVGDQKFSLATETTLREPMRAGEIAVSLLLPVMLDEPLPPHVDGTKYKVT